MLPITLTIAAAAALMNIWLAVRAIRTRFATKTENGDGGNPIMLARMRAHANFAEYTPFVLILLGLLEYAKGPQGWLWLTGIVYLVGRVLHPFGLERRAPNPLRAAGMLATFGVLLVLAVAAIVTVYSGHR